MKLQVMLNPAGGMPGSWIIVTPDGKRHGFDAVEIAVPSATVTEGDYMRGRLRGWIVCDGRLDAAGKTARILPDTAR